MTSTDRARRRTITCASCGETAAHRGHGYCVTCYTRWVYHGRPAAGPPAPGTKPRKPPAKPDTIIPAFCTHGHRLNSSNLRFNADGHRYCLVCKRASEKAYAEKRFAERHDGHDVIPTSDGRRYCRTCNRGDHDIDEIVIVRTVGGDRPERVSAAELASSVIELRGFRYPYRLIAERTGCSLRHAWWICDKAGLTKKRGAAA